MLYCLNADAQYLLGFHTENDDLLGEWVVEVEIDSTTIIEGSLELTYGLGSDTKEWQYSIGDFDGDILQKFKNDPTLWELRSDGETVTIKQTWRNDPTEWKITKGDQSMTIKSINGNNVDEWAVSDKNIGDFVIFTDRRGDPRDWIIDDYMNDVIPFDMRLAAGFIAVYSVVTLVR